MSWFAVLLFFTTSAAPQAGASDRFPNYVIEDARPTAELPTWDTDLTPSVAVEGVEPTETITTDVEDDIEAESARLESDLQQPAPAPAIVTEEENRDDREVLWTFAASREFAPTAKASAAAPGSSLVNSKFTDEDAEPAEPRIKLRPEKGVLPQTSVTRLSDARLRRLCEDLKEANHLTLEATSGATIRNFRQDRPLLMKMGRLQEVAHVQARFVGFVGRRGARIQTLKNVKSPHLLCDVRVSAIQDVHAPVIVVGLKPRPSIIQNPHVRWVAPEVRQATVQP